MYHLISPEQFLAAPVKNIKQSEAKAAQQTFLSFVYCLQVFRERTIGAECGVQIGFTHHELHQWLGDDFWLHLDELQYTHGSIDVKELDFAPRVLITPSEDRWIAEGCIVKGITKKIEMNALQYYRNTSPLALCEQLAAIKLKDLGDNKLCQLDGRHPKLQGSFHKVFNEDRDRWEAHSICGRHRYYRDAVDNFRKLGEEQTAMKISGWKRRLTKAGIESLTFSTVMKSLPIWFDNLKATP